MQKSGRILLTGDRTYIDFHRMPVEAICSLFPAGAEIVVDEHYEGYDQAALAEFDLIFVYVTNWSDKTANVPHLADRLMTYVLQGGGILLSHVLRMGITDYEMTQMVGARYRMRAPMGEVSYAVPENGHPITAGVTDFVLRENRYMIHTDFGPETAVVLEFRHSDGACTPAGWARDYGLGRLVYLHPGHDETVFAHEQVQKLYQNAIGWLTAGREERI